MIYPKYLFVCLGVCSSLYGVEMCLTPQARLSMQISQAFQEGQTDALQKLCQPSSYGWLLKKDPFYWELKRCQAGVALRLGDFLRAKLYFNELIVHVLSLQNPTLEDQSSGAISAYRLGELEETVFLHQLKQIKPALFLDDFLLQQTQVLSSFKAVEEAYGRVFEFQKATFWHSRALYRLAYALREVIDFVLEKPNLSYREYQRISPFELPLQGPLQKNGPNVYFVYDLIGLLGREIRKKSPMDGELINELSALEEKTYFYTYPVELPWKNRLPVGIVRFSEEAFWEWHGDDWHRIEADKARQVVKKNLKITNPEPVSLAYSMVTALRLDMPIDAAILRHALGSPHQVLRLAAYQCIEKKLLNPYFDDLIAALVQKQLEYNQKPLFPDMQEALWGERERLIFAILALIEQHPENGMAFFDLETIPVLERAYGLAKLRQRGLRGIYEKMSKHSQAEVRLLGKQALEKLQVAKDLFKRLPLPKGNKNQMMPIMTGEP